MVDNYANGQTAQNAALNRKILRAQKQKVPYYNPDYDNLPREPQSLSQVRAKIKEFQKSLNALGANIRVDGIIGPETKQAYAKYHIQMIPSSKTGKNLFPTINYKQFTENPFFWQSMMDRTKSPFTELRTKKSSIVQTTNKESQNQTKKSEQSSLWDRILSGITNDAKVEQEREKAFYRIERIKPPSQMSLSEKFDYFKRTGDWENLKKLYRAHPELIRAYDSLQEIVNHKKKHNVRDPYVIIDKKHGNEYITDSEGNTVKCKVATGKRNKDEIRNIIPYKRDFIEKRLAELQSQPQTKQVKAEISKLETFLSKKRPHPFRTPSGIFTLDYRHNEDYSGLPGIFLIRDISNGPLNNAFSNIALHGIPIKTQRGLTVEQKRKPPLYTRKEQQVQNGQHVSSGCIRHSDEGMNALYQNLDTTGLRNDTLYMLPSNKDARIIEVGDQLVFMHPNQIKQITSNSDETITYTQQPVYKTLLQSLFDKIIDVPRQFRKIKHNILNKI